MTRRLIILLIVILVPAVPVAAVILFSTLISSRAALFLFDLGRYPMAAAFWLALYFFTPIVISLFLPGNISNPKWSILKNRAFVVYTACLITIFFANIASIEVYLILNDKVVQKRLLGFSRLAYRMENGETADIVREDWGSVIIINDSSRSVRIDRVLYVYNKYYQQFTIGRSETGTTVIAVIPPRRILDVRTNVDYLGPSDAPPQSILVSNGTLTATRTWLTW